MALVAALGYSLATYYRSKLGCFGMGPVSAFQNKPFVNCESSMISAFMPRKARING